MHACIAQKVRRGLRKYPLVDLIISLHRPLDVRLLILNTSEQKEGAMSNELTSYFEEFDAL